MLVGKPPLPHPHPPECGVSVKCQRRTSTSGAGGSNPPARLPPATRQRAVSSTPRPPSDGRPSIATPGAARPADQRTESNFLCLAANLALAAAVALGALRRPARHFLADRAPPRGRKATRERLAVDRCGCSAIMDEGRARDGGRVPHVAWCGASNGARATWGKRTDRAQRRATCPSRTTAGN